MDIYSWKDYIIDELRNGRINPEDNQRLISMAQLEEDSVRREIADSILKEESNNIYCNIWLYSFAMSVYPQPMTLKNMIMLVKYSFELDYKQKYFLFQQINSMIFKYKSCNTDDITRLAWELLEDILKSCKDSLKIDLKRIPVSERNQSISIVLVEQYLTEGHGPTKTALDRSYVLKTMFGQEVMIINTAEMLTPANYVYVEEMDIANYVQQYSDRETVSWKGETFRYYQCPQTMPSDDGILELVSLVQTIKPASIVLVGGTSLVAGVLNELVPVITVGTLLSRLAMTLADYQIVSRNMLEDAAHFMEYMGKSTEHIIPGRFTYALKPQEKHITRETIGIDEDAFAIAVVGGRLTDEVTDELLTMFEKCFDCIPDDKKMVIGVIGICDNIDEKLQRHPILKEKIIYTGVVKDILSVIEHFDLYVNPIRRGGGTSVIEAMYKKIPAVTVDYGDVAEIVGDQFCCKDYDEMVPIIKEYITNKKFYEAQAKLAGELADEYLDSSKEFTRIMKEYYKLQGME